MTEQTPGPDRHWGERAPEDDRTLLWYLIGGAVSAVVGIVYNIGWWNLIGGLAFTAISALAVLMLWCRWTLTVFVDGLLGPTTLDEKEHLRFERAQEHADNHQNGPDENPIADYYGHDLLPTPADEGKRLLDIVVAAHNPPRTDETST